MGPDCNKNCAQSCSRPQTPIEHVAAVVTGHLVTAKADALKICINVIMKDHRIPIDLKYPIADRMTREVWGEE